MNMIDVLFISSAISIISLIVYFVIAGNVISMSNRMRRVESYLEEISRHADSVSNKMNRICEDQKFWQEK
jgi:uncharacterized protein YoxC